ncbi:MAG: IclR family transcriptional regulator C-terminal domain-containing protein [Candidatus Competibacteraceae bacterium]
MPHSITEPKVLWQAIRNIPRQGYALDDQEAELGIGCIGAPIRDANNRVVAGLSISAAIGRRQDTWIPLLLHAANAISARLGYNVSVIGTPTTGSSAYPPLIPSSSGKRLG